MAGISNMPLGNSIDFPTSLGTRRKGTRGEDTVVKVTFTYGLQHPNLIVGLHRAPYTVTPRYQEMDVIRRGRGSKDLCDSLILLLRDATLRYLTWHGRL